MSRTESSGAVPFHPTPRIKWGGNGGEQTTLRSPDEIQPLSIPRVVYKDGCCRKLKVNNRSCH